MQDENDCYVEPKEKQADAGELKNLESEWFSIAGMGCPNCSNRVRNSLLELEGVSSAMVDHRRGVAIVDFNPAKATLEDLARAVSAAGKDSGHAYSATPFSQVVVL